MTGAADLEVFLDDTPGETRGVIARGGVILVDKRASADVVVLTHERRWATYPTVREELRGWRVLAEKRIDGVPLWTVLRRP